MDISDRIKSARKARGYTQKELSQLINVSPQVISNWERKYTTPDPEDIKNLSESLDVTIDYLYGNTNDDDIILIREELYHEPRSRKIEIRPKLRVNRPKDEALLKKYNMLGETLRKTRINLGLSEHELAAQIGTTVDRVVDWEENKRVPSSRELAAISSLARIPVKQLLTDGDPLTVNGVELPSDIQDAIQDITKEIIKINDPKKIKQLIRMIQSLVQSFNEESE